MIRTSLVAFALAIAAIGCTQNTSKAGLLSPTAPTVQAVVYDSSVVWDAAQIGRVTVTNPRATPLTLTFMLWDYRSEFNQTSIAAATYVIAPGTTQVLTVGTQNPACKVQRDLYEGKHAVGDTLNDLANFLYAGGGVMDTGCKPTIIPLPPIVPPVVPSPPSKCMDPKATNYGKPLPCIVIPPCKPHYGDKTYTKPKPCYTSKN